MDRIRVLTARTIQEMNPSLAHAAFTLRADQGVMANIYQPDRGCRNTRRESYRGCES